MTKNEQTPLYPENKAARTAAEYAMDEVDLARDLAEDAKSQPTREAALANLETARDLIEDAMERLEEHIPALQEEI